MSENKPTQFKDLDAKELYRSALEDFALPIDDSEKSSKKLLLAAFVEGGVEWSDYVAQHPEVAPEEPKNVVTAPTLKPNDDPSSAPVVTPQKPRAAQPVAPEPDATYLIKMERENALYQTRGYTFTADHPYAVVNADDVDYILTREDGFRQATPLELREFYG